MSKKSWKITYWITTVLLLLVLLPGGVLDAIQVQSAIDLVSTHLGYPVYFLTIIGVAKVLGSIGILQTKWPLAREWAYAGITFDLGGAVLSSMAVGDTPAQYLPVLAMLIILVGGSYVSMKKIGK